MMPAVDDAMPVSCESLDMTANASNKDASATNSNLPTVPNRLFRSFWMFDNRDFLPRPFQIELYETCKSQDTIIFLRPGNGKHFLSLMLLKHFAPEVSNDSAQGNRRIFFIGRSVQSIRQYASVFYAHTNMRLAEYTETGEEFDKIASSWPSRFNQSDVHLMLDSLFAKLLELGLVRAEQIKLLILDDVHQILLTNTNQTDRYEKILQLLQPNTNIPRSFRILGLSASILLENIPPSLLESALARIEQALPGCRCSTYADLRMICKYSIQCRIRVRRFPLKRMANESEALRASLHRIRILVPELHASFDHLPLQDTEMLVSYQLLSQTLLDVLYVYGSLGEWCTFHLVELVSWELCRTLTLLKKTQSVYLAQLNTVYHVLQIIKTSLLAYLPADIATKLVQSSEARMSQDKSIPARSRLTLSQLLSISSPKLHLLARVLNDYLDEQKSAMNPNSNFHHFTFPANICGIVYAHNRSVVRMLSMWLQEVTHICGELSKHNVSKANNCLAYLQPDYVFLRDDIQAIETRNIYYDRQQKSLHEIHFYRRQEEVLKRFRFANECNLLVTTSMAAEGLDVNRCNLVVAFDAPTTFHQFVLIKGRIRVEGGLFVTLVAKSQDLAIIAQEDTIHYLERFCETEKIFTKLVPQHNEICFEDDGEPWMEFSSNELATLPASLVASIEENRGSSRGGRGRGGGLHSRAAAVKSEETLEDAKKTKSASGFELTVENAILVLNRYCLKLPSDTFTKMAPNYRVELVAPQAEHHGPRYRCRLYLPINSNVRGEIVGEIAESEQRAKQLAAHRAVVTLRQAGELDANYMPLGRETNRYIEKLGLQECCAPVTPAHNTRSARGRGARFSGRANRLQARNIASKRRQFYRKKVANALQGNGFQIRGGEKVYVAHLYQIRMKLTCPIPEEQNVRGRRIVDPAETSLTLGLLVPNCLPPICEFTIYNRSGEVMVALDKVQPDSIQLHQQQVDKLIAFHHFIFSDKVLRLSNKTGMELDLENASNGNYLVVPVNETVDKAIDWTFVQSIVDYIHKRNVDEKKPSIFKFDPTLYQDAVVIPRYRAEPQPSFYVAEICSHLTPRCPFPDEGFETFEEYYRLKYKQTLTNLDQPLLDVDHTSSRLNYLTPRYLNRKGMTLPASSASTRQAKQASLQQKQILVPELCTIHPFPASFWRKVVCLPAILFRVNSLVVADELREKIAIEAAIGLPKATQWPRLDFGWSAVIKKIEEDKAKQAKEEQSIVQPKIDWTPPKKKKDKKDPKVKPIEPENVTNKISASRDDPFSSMGDWDSFSSSAQFQPICPAMFTESAPSAGPAEQPLIEILSISSSLPPTSSPSYDVPPATSSSRAIPVDEFLSMKLDDEDEQEDPEIADIVEVDGDGNPIANNRINRAAEKKTTIRYGSPTNFKHYDDDDGEEIEEKQAKEESFANIDWFKACESDGDHDSIPSEACFEINMEKLCQDLTDPEFFMSDDEVVLIEDFLHEAKQTQEDEDETYSDFEVENEDGQDGGGGGLFYEEDDEEDDDDDEDEDDDEDDDDFVVTRANKKGKKNDDKIPLLDDEESGKSYIYDCLQFELLYDVNKFEEYLDKCQSYYRRIVGQNEELEKEIRSKRKLFTKLYQCERRQVLLALKNMGLAAPEQQSHLNYALAIEPDCEQLFSPNFTIKDQPLLMLLFETFSEFDLHIMLEKWNEQAAIDNDLAMLEAEHDESEAESLECVIQYYHASKAAEEIKFGELLPNRLAASSQQFMLDPMLDFSFDRSASSMLWGPHPSLVLQAMTMSNSSDAINLERLETVGDSFLKYSITVFLYIMCPDLNEGKLSFLRSRQISNINLHRLGQRIELGASMNASKFEPNDNWCPPAYRVQDEVVSVTKQMKHLNLLTQHSIPNKSIADCVEALIGGYLVASGQLGAVKLMHWLGLKVLPDEWKLAQPGSHHWLAPPPSPLASCSASMDMSRLDTMYTSQRLDVFESQLGYRFRDRSYLIQAFTHNSYYENNLTDCYQRLEFLGDAVLDYLITRYLYEDKRAHSPGTLTDLRSALVNNTFFASLAVKYNFHKYLLMLSNELYRVIDGFVRKFNLVQGGAGDYDPQSNDEDDETAAKKCNYWQLFISEQEAENLEDIEVPKALGDIFESVAGAIYLDSGMSLDAVWKVYYPMMKPEIENFSFNVPKSPIRVLLEKYPSQVQFSKPEITTGRKVRVCVEAFNVGKFVGVARNKRIAKCTAAKRALRAHNVMQLSRMQRFRRRQEELHDFIRAGLE